MKFLWLVAWTVLSLASPAAALAELPTRPGASAPEAPDACHLSPNAVLCEWFVNTSDAPNEQAWTFQMPGFNRSLVGVTVSLDGVDQGWSYDIVTAHGAPSTARHDPTPGDGAGLHIARSSHFVVGPADAPWTLRFRSVSCTCVGAVNPGHLGQWSVASEGKFHVQYNSTRLPAGEVPVHPAATQADPQLLDQGDDSPRPEYDLLAAWFDEPHVGDGTFAVHVAMASLAHVEANATGAFPYHGEWTVDFAVGEDTYEMGWEAYIQGAQSPFVDCYLGHLTGPHENTLLHPLCEFNATASMVSAEIPTAAVGSPGIGQPFAKMRAYAGESDGLSQDEIAMDSVTGERYVFALGGPVVWDKLNPRLASAPVQTAAWYADPLARDNLPNTMQVVGGFLAAGSFLVGILVLQRRRAQTRRLLDEIEAIERAHERDAGRALLELGRLETDFTRQLRNGKLNEAQYQTLSQRIAAAATRFALRRELGLEEVRA